MTRPIPYKAKSSIIANSSAESNKKKKEEQQQHQQQDSAKSRLFKAADQPAKRSQSICSTGQHTNNNSNSSLRASSSTSISSSSSSNQSLKSPSTMPKPSSVQQQMQSHPNKSELKRSVAERPRWPSFRVITLLMIVGSLTLFTISADCDRMFLPSHLPNSAPLASFFMTNFPGLANVAGGASAALMAPPVASPYVGFAPHHQQQHQQHGGYECEYNANHVVDHILDRMRINLPEEKIMVQNGAITIYDAQIVRFAELARLKNSCARKLDPSGSRLSMPFEAEIRTAHVQAKIKYNFYVTDIYGDYSANFSHIRMNGTLEADMNDEYVTVSQFNITSSQVVGDSIVFGYVPKWILDWVRSYFDNDNTEMYQQLAKQILQKEADHFRHFEMVREILQPQVMGREEEILNRI